MSYCKAPKQSGRSGHIAHAAGESPVMSRSVSATWIQVLQVVRTDVQDNIFLLGKSRRARIESLTAAWPISRHTSKRPPTFGHVVIPVESISVDGAFARRTSTSVTSLIGSYLHASSSQGAKHAGPCSRDSHRTWRREMLQSPGDGCAPHYYIAPPCLSSDPRRVPRGQSAELNRLISSRTTLHPNQACTPSQIGKRGRTRPADCPYEGSTLWAMAFGFAS